MKFKLLIFDLDGTAVESSRYSLPSKRLIASVEAAQKKLKVSVATGRTFSYCIDILRILGLLSPVVISGGAQIVDPQTEKILWQKAIPQKLVKQVLGICKNYPYLMALGDDPGKLPASEIKSLRPFETVIFIHSLEEGDVGAVLESLAQIPQLAAKTGNSFVKGKVDMNITLKEATKEHGLETLLEMLEVDPREVLAVGDSNNDLALFQNVGFKVAMGNATNELKEVADFIAPTIEEDGLVSVIEKFILEED